MLVKDRRLQVCLIHYICDILLLPSEFKGPNNNVTIPRSKKRTLLAQAGLVGKIELNLDNDVHEEVCEEVMRLTEDDIKNDSIHIYRKQQDSLHSFSKRIISMEVATLAKSGGVIYILA